MIAHVFRLAVAVALLALLPPADFVVSTQIGGGVFEHAVARGDTLASLASRFGVDAREIAAANSLPRSAVLSLGRILRLDNRHIVPTTADDTRIVINVPQRMLFLLEAGALVAAYPVAVGARTTQTPLGGFEIVLKEEDPTWNVPLSIQEEMRREGRPVLTSVPPGPDNPLGRFWLGLSLPSVGIHGTNSPRSIYRHVTHGCIRMHPDDVTALYSRVETGTAGRIVYEPVLLAETAEGIFLEAHPDVYRMATDTGARVRQLAAAGDLVDDIDWSAVALELTARRGVARLVGMRRQPSARGQSFAR